MAKCLRPHHGMCFQFYEGDAEHDMYIGEVVDIIR